MVGGAESSKTRGGVLQAQGKLEQAQAAFAEYLAISQRLAEQDPSNAGWQRDLAVAHSKVGGVLEAQGKLEQAQAAFAECLAISRRLAEQDPSNAGWQRDLAIAHSRVGGVLEAQGKYLAADHLGQFSLRAVHDRRAEDLSLPLEQTGDRTFRPDPQPPRPRTRRSPKWLSAIRPPILVAVESSRSSPNTVEAVCARE
jgi:Flp pilus assembly protein TadD